MAFVLILNIFIDILWLNSYFSYIFTFETLFSFLPPLLLLGIKLCSSVSWDPVNLRDGLLGSYFCKSVMMQTTSEVEVGREHLA